MTTPENKPRPTPSLFSPCKEVIRLASRSLDERLTWKERTALRLHLLLCSFCRRYARQVRFLRENLHQHPDAMTDAVCDPLPPEKREQLKQRLRDAIKQDL